MSIVLTYWRDSDQADRSPEDYDGIRTVVLKTVKQIPDLILSRPKHCTAISVEHSAERTLKSGRRTNFFKFVWQGERYPHVCRTCGAPLRGR